MCCRIRTGFFLFFHCTAGGAVLTATLINVIRGFRTIFKTTWSAHSWHVKFFFEFCAREPKIHLLVFVVVKLLCICSRRPYGDFQSKVGHTRRHMHREKNVYSESMLRSHVLSICAIRRQAFPILILYPALDGSWQAAIVTCSVVSNHDTRGSRRSTFPLMRAQEGHQSTWITG